MIQQNRNIELAFQVGWIPIFSANKKKVKDYFEKYMQLDSMIKIMGINKKSNVLDVGCGVSSILHFMDCDKTGLDILAAEYRKVYNYPDDMDIKTGFGENMPFRKEVFDTVFCTNALDHMEKPEKVVNEIIRVLKPGGNCLISVEVFNDKKTRNSAHPFSFKPGEVSEIINNKMKCLVLYNADWFGLKNYVKGRDSVGTVEVSIWGKAC